MMGPFEPGIGPMRLKVDACGPDEGPPEHVNCLFSLNFDSERLQYIIVWIKNGPQGSERGVKFHPFPPPGCATADKVSLVWDEPGWCRFGVLWILAG